MRPEGKPEPSRRLRAAASATPTYPELGATTGALPSGYRHVRRSARIGDGMVVFDAAVRQLLGWGMHRGAGLEVEATAASAVLGSTVVLRATVGPLRFFAPCRVVVVVDDPQRKGFAYGTLPGHPELGEELFVVTLDDDEHVHIDITAFSRPSRRSARLGRPVSDRVQDRVTDRYVAALQSDP